MIEQINKHSIAYVSKLRSSTMAISNVRNPGLNLGCGNYFCYFSPFLLFKFGIGLGKRQYMPNVIFI